MPKPRKQTPLNSTDRLIRTLIVVQLGLAGVNQRQIRSIVGANINEINSIVKALRRKKSPIE